MRIDLNADVGEGFAEDEAVIALVSSVNVACGAHAGDPMTIERTIALARRFGAAVGAHPAYPDRDGFGRRDMEMSSSDLTATLVDQVATVARAGRLGGGELSHVKPHGALYNRAARDPAVAETVARAIRRVSADLVLVGLAGSVALEAGSAAGLRVAAEAFADRRYEPDGRLRDRREPDALLHDPLEAAAQAVAIVRDGAILAVDGSRLELRADTLCVHGDAPGAAARVRAVRHALEAEGVEIRPIDP